MQDASASMPILIYTGFAEHACRTGFYICVNDACFLSCQEQLACLECVSVRSANTMISLPVIQRCTLPCNCLAVGTFRPCRRKGCAVQYIALQLQWVQAPAHQNLKHFCKFALAHPPKGVLWLLLGHPLVPLPFWLMQSLVMARDIDTAWKEVADIQQAGLDAALAAQSKARKPKPSKPASMATDATANDLQPQLTSSNGNEAGSAALPDQDAASGPQTGQAGAGPGSGAGPQQAGDAPEASEEGNGHRASEENQAANKQLPGSAQATASSMGKDQVRLSILACCAQTHVLYSSQCMPLVMR